MPSNYHEFNIYFSDLNEEAQKRFLEAVGVEDVSELDWDVNINSIATYTFED